MFSTIKTLILGANASAEENLRDTYAIPLIEQKIRETEANLRAAKVTLASLIQRERSEARMLATLDDKIADMTTRAQEALDAGRDTLAAEAANAIAQMENERAMRRATLDRLEQKVARLKTSVDAGHRRIVDLRQGAVAAKAVRKEQQIQSRMRRTIGGSSSADEAEDLIRKVIGKDDPFEQSEILAEIDAELSHDGLAEKMAGQGFGKATKSTGADVLARLKDASNETKD